MTKLNPGSPCPKCGGMKVREWKRLSEDEKMIARRLPKTSTLDEGELKKTVYCVGCWNVSLGRRSELV